MKFDVTLGMLPCSCYVATFKLLNLAVKKKNHLLPYRIHIANQMKDKLSNAV